jgi:hypothetical protein
MHYQLLAKAESETGKGIRCNVVCKTTGSWFDFAKVEQQE